METFRNYVSSPIRNEERYCEICGGLVGIMSDRAWKQMDAICDICYEKILSM